LHGEGELEILSGVTMAADATALSATNELIVEVGGSLGLAEMLRRQDQREIDRATVVTLTQPETLPEKWYAYEGVDMVAIAGRTEIEKSFLSVAAIDALEQWVRMGGNLLIACGEDARQVVGEGAPLARFAPGTLSEIDSLRSNQFGAIETFAKVEAQERLIAKQAIRIPVWTNVKGLVELSAGSQAADLPLVVRYPLGFGQVTFVGLDLDRPPLAEWAGRTKFLEALLARHGAAANTTGNSSGAAQAARYGYIDLSGQLRGALDQFERVEIVPFWLVAALALAYLLLLFPAGYWLVARGWKWQAGAWIVFPATLCFFAGCAIAVANYSKGVARHLNQVDLVDVDLSAGTARGTTWFNLFSAENAIAEVGVMPGRVGDGADTGAAANRTEETLLGWFGLAGSGVGGMDSKAVSAPLLDEPYTMDLATGKVLGVPLSAWSSKSFVARWEASAGGIEADLKGAANHRLQGRLVNRLDVALTDCELMYGGWVFSLGNLARGQSVDVERVIPVTARTYLTKQHVRFDSSEEITPYDRAGFDVGRIVEMMMFHTAAGGESYAGLLDRQQRFTDLSDQLSFDRAILVCHGPAGAAVQIDGRPAPEGELDHRMTVYRYLMPVRPRD
jgi:hypothetical protein